MEETLLVIIALTYLAIEALVRLGPRMPRILYSRSPRLRFALLDESEEQQAELCPGCKRAYLVVGDANVGVDSDPQSTKTRGPPYERAVR